MGRFLSFLCADAEHAKAFDFWGLFIEIVKNVHFIQFSMRICRESEVLQHVALTSVGRN